MNNRSFFLTNKLFNKTTNLLLSTILLSLSMSYQSIAAYATRKEAAAQYKICEKKNDLIDKIYCMRSLRKSLGDYDESSYSGSLYDKSDKELRTIYRKERKRAQVKIARLPVNR